MTAVLDLMGPFLAVLTETGREQQGTEGQSWRRESSWIKNEPKVDGGEFRSARAASGAAKAWDL